MSISIVGPINTGVTTGGEGVSTANATSTTQIVGRVAAIYIRYNDNAPATSDITIATAGNSAPAYTILSVANSATDTIYYPRAAIRSQQAASIYYDVGGTRIVYDHIVIADNVTVTIAQANDGDSADVWLFMMIP